MAYRFKIECYLNIRHMQCAITLHFLKTIKEVKNHQVLQNVNSKILIT
jgi:hypothetical protein